KAVPLPPPPGLMKAITAVTVANDADADDGFQITLTVGKDALLDYGILSSGALDPMTRVVIGVLLGVVPEVLIDGVVTHQELQPSNEPGMSTLTVTGKDLTQVLDLDERNDKYENQPDFLIFTRLIAQYARDVPGPDLQAANPDPVAPVAPGPPARPGFRPGTAHCPAPRHGERQSGAGDHDGSRDGHASAGGGHGDRRGRRSALRQGPA